MTKHSKADVGCQQVFPSAAEISSRYGGFRTAKGYMMRCPAHADKKQSCSVTDGRVGRPVFYCFTGCTQDQIKDALRADGIWPGFVPGQRSEDCRKGKIDRQQAAAFKRELTAREKEDADRARMIFDRAFPCLDSSPAMAYLMRRGIWEPAQKSSLRYTRLPHPQTHEINVPCIIVPRHNTATGELVGIQRLFITEDGYKYTKEFTDYHGVSRAADHKMILGSAPDSWCMLRNQTETWYDEIPLDMSEPAYSETTDTLILAEGMENALSATVLFGGHPSWCKAGGFPKTIELPDTVKYVLICADNDPRIKGGREHRTSRDRAEELREFITGTGRYCFIWEPGMEKQDANDVLLASNA